MSNLSRALPYIEHDVPAMDLTFPMSEFVHIEGVLLQNTGESSEEYENVLYRKLLHLGRAHRGKSVQAVVVDAQNDSQSTFICIFGKSNLYMKQ